MAQTNARTRNLLKFLEPMSRAPASGPASRPTGGGGSIPASRLKLDLWLFDGVTLQVFFVKLTRVQSANTRVYVLGRIVCAS